MQDIKEDMQTMEKQNINSKTADMILVFPDEQKRTEFFDTKVMADCGVLWETFFDSPDEILISDVGIASIVEIVSVAMEFGGKHILNCGGKNLSDCDTYEKNCGKICDYCQYMELDVRIDKKDNIE